MADAISREAELEEVTDALLVTSHDDFNALAAAELRTELGHGRVHRVAPRPGTGDLLAPVHDAGIVADRELTFDELQRRLTDGSRLVGMRADGPADGAGPVVLFAVSPAGELRVATDGASAPGRPGDTVVALRPPDAPAPPAPALWRIAVAAPDAGARPPSIPGTRRSPE